MKVYEGVRHQSGCCVTVSDDATGGVPVPLDPRLDLLPYIPPGLGWGESSVTSLRLAVALLADATGDDECARGMAWALASLVLAHVQTRTWEVTDEQVRAWVETGRLDGHKLW